MEQPDAIEIMAREIRPAAFNDAHAFAAREWATVLARGAVKALDEAGFAIVPKQLPESAMHAGNLDAEDSDQYEVLVEHCRVKL